MPGGRAAEGAAAGGGGRGLAGWGWRSGAARPGRLRRVPAPRSEPAAAGRVRGGSEM